MMFLGKRFNKAPYYNKIEALKKRRLRKESYFKTTRY